MNLNKCNANQHILIYLLTFVGAMGNPIVLPALPFFMEDLNITPMQLGMIISVYALPGAIILPLYGIISDRIGRRKVLLFSLVICMLGSLLCAFSNNFYTLLMGRALQGLSITPLDALSFTLAADFFEGRERMKIVQRCSSVQFLCVCSVPFILSLIIPCYGWRSSFVFSFLLSLSVLMLSFPVNIPYLPSKNRNIRQFVTHLGTLLIRPYLILLFFVRVLIAFMIFGVIYPHLPLLMVQKLNSPPEFVGFMFSIYALGMLCGSLLVPVFLRCISQGVFGLLGGILILVSVVLIMISEALIFTGLGLFLAGIGSGLLTPQNTAHVSLATTPDTKGSIMSAYSTIFRVGQSAAPVVMGGIYSVGGFNSLFCSAIVLAVLTAGFAGLSFRMALEKEKLETGI